MIKLKNNVAYIVNQISTITGHPPVKKALQKTVFLIEQKGVELGFDYILHFYGPYCAELDRTTSILSTDGIINFDYSGYGHKMSISDEYRNIESENLTPEQRDIIGEVINRYKDKTPSDLELLTTAIYAYQHTGATTRNIVIENVKKIKGTKYSDSEIAWALNEFPYFGFVF